MSFSGKSFISLGLIYCCMRLVIDNGFVAMIQWRSLGKAEYRELSNKGYSWKSFRITKKELCTIIITSYLWVFSLANTKGEELNYDTRYVC